jgi:tetratricopeptide (TPR) repeat protein
LKPRALSAEDEERIKELDERIDKLRRAGRFDEAIAPARQVAEVCERSLGPDHWRSCDARRSVQDLETFRDLPEEGRRAIASVPALFEESGSLQQSARYAEAERVDRELLDILRRWLGEGHLDTVTAYSNLTVALRAQGKHAEAEAMFRKALDIDLRALGEGYPDTAISYIYLAHILDDRDRSEEALRY